MVVARIPAYGGKAYARRRRFASRNRQGSIWSRHPEYAGIVILAGCVFLGLALVSLPATTAKLGYEIVSLRAELDALQRDVSRLQLELARLESLDRIEQIARERLGMREPEQLRLVQLGEPAANDPGNLDPWRPQVEGAVQRLASGVRGFIARAVVGRPVQAGSGP
ncbi:MAG: cell division protein FtsL [Bacillota bacterium]